MIGSPVPQAGVEASKLSFWRFFSSDSKRSYPLSYSWWVKPSWKHATQRRHFLTFLFNETCPWSSSGIHLLREKRYGVKGIAPLPTGTKKRFCPTWLYPKEVVLGRWGDPRSNYLVSVHSVYASQSLSVRDHGGDDKTNEANDGFSSPLFS